MSTRVEQIAEEILEHARVAGLSVVVAESCTAGRLATAFAKGSGAAQHFIGGFITYTKEAKTLLLNVPPEMLAEETAVSANVAAAMARGAAVKARASLAVAVTGVTGSEPDEDGNPVGLVFCAAARADGGVKTLQLRLGDQPPDELVEQGCEAALSLLRDFAFA
jgi:nicotinamide-nucleotide amidase